MALEGKKILLVEDDALISEMLSKKLIEAKAEVTYAGNGEIALAKLAETKFDLVLLDLMLPKVDGYAVLTKMKEEGKTDTTPVIVLSNLGQKVDTEKATSLGAKKFLVKALLSLDEVAAVAGELV